MGGLITFPQSKICNLAQIFLAIQKYTKTVQKLLMSGFFCLKSTFCIFFLKNSFRKHSWKRFFVSCKFLICLGDVIVVTPSWHKNDINKTACLSILFQMVINEQKQFLQQSKMITVHRQYCYPSISKFSRN